MIPTHIRTNPRTVTESKETAPARMEDLGAIVNVIRRARRFVGYSMRGDTRPTWVENLRDANRTNFQQRMLKYWFESIQAMEAGDPERTARVVRGVGGFVLGAGEVVTKTEHHKTTHTITALHVDPSVRRQGVGWQLLGELCKGKNRLYVTTTKDSEAVPFYEAFGFKPTGRHLVHPRLLDGQLLPQIELVWCADGSSPDADPAHVFGDYEWEDGMVQNLREWRQTKENAA